MPSPPEYCGSTSVIPNSGEKYAMLAGAGCSAVPWDWYQRGSVRYRWRSSCAACSRPRNSPSSASDCKRPGGTAPRRRVGSSPSRSHISGSMEDRRSRVGACHDQRRLLTSSPRGASGSGRTVRTVNRRIARMRANPNRPKFRRGYAHAPQQVSNHPSGVSSRPMPARTGRIPIVDVAPVIACGRWPAKSVVGESFVVSATVFREGHDLLGANVVLRGPRGAKGPWAPMRLLAAGTDRWGAEVAADTEGEWTFHVEAWGDPMGSWLHAAEIKVPAGLDVELMLEEGALLFERAAGGVKGAERDLLGGVVKALRDETRPATVRLAAATAADVAQVLARKPLRELVTRSDRYPLRVERERALYGSWYEFFPRSVGAVQNPDGSWQSGTFATAAV